MNEGSALFNQRYFSSRDECPVCGSNQYKIIYSCSLTSDPIRGMISTHYRCQGLINWEYLEGTDYTICDCTNCELIYQRNIPNDVVLNQIYNVMISPVFLKKFETSLLTVGNFENIANELGALFRRISKHPTQALVLDYGFGYGRWARVAVAMGAKVFATEISPEKISFAQTIGVEIIDDGAISEMRFDLIHAEQVFEHLTHPRQVFERLASALAPGGVMIVGVPRQGKIRRLLKQYGMIDWSPLEGAWNPDVGKRGGRRYQDYNCIIPLEHLNAFSRKAIETLGNNSDLRLLSQLRRQVIPLHLSNVSAMGQSVVELSKTFATPMLRRESGSYIFGLKK
jgi:SAM-dependent methyltransferase